jgi:hypothetical protein
MVAAVQPPNEDLIESTPVVITLKSEGDALSNLETVKEISLNSEFQ